MTIFQPPFKTGLEYKPKGERIPKSFNYLLAQIKVKGVSCHLSLKVRGE
jgi:hypothetical protein